MTEADWLDRDKPTKMLSFLRETRGESKDARRKLRLVLAACCRRVWPRIEDPLSRRLIEASERYADGDVPFAELKALWDAHREEVGRRPWGACLAWDAAHRDIWQGALESWAWLKSGMPPALAEPEQAALYREVFGNPFRPVAVDRAWQTPTARALATAAYEERHLPTGELDPARLAVLADALEEAGCDCAELLSHLRSPRPHVRGCWAVDLLRPNLNRAGR